MRKLLLAIITLILLTSCAAKEDPTIKNDPIVDPDPPAREHKDITHIPVVNYAIENNIVFEHTSDYPSTDCLIYRPVISGLIDKEVENKINNAIIEACNKYADDNYIPPFKGYQVILKQLGEKYKKEVSINCFECANYNNILSIAIIADYSFTKGNYYKSIEERDCLNFDLRDGSQINVLDIFDDKEAGLDYINDQIKKYIVENNSYDEVSSTYMGVVQPVLFSEKFESILENQRFNFSETGNGINIIFDYNNPEYVPIRTLYFSEGLGSGSIYIDLDGICNTIEKFKSDKQLYINNETSKMLLSHADFVTNRIYYVGDFGYEEIEEDILGACTYVTTNDEYLNSLVDIPALYDKTLQEARTIRDQYYADGKKKNTFTVELYVNGDIEKVGKYYSIDIYNNLTSYSYNTGGFAEHIVERNSYCLDEKYNILKLEDIFIDDADYLEELTNAAYNKLLESSNEMYVGFELWKNNDEETIKNEIKELIKHISGFSFTNYGLNICFEQDYINEYIKQESILNDYYYMVESLEFKYINNLNIFE